MNTPPLQIPVARVVRAHGVRGELRVLLYNPSSALLRPGLQVWVQPRAGGPGLRTIRRLRAQQADLLITLDGVEDRDAAEALRGAELCVARAALPAPSDDEYYAVDLIGCAVRDEQDRALGTIAQVSDNGAQDLLHVHDGDREWLLPLVSAYVAEVDVDGRALRVRGVQELVALGQVRTTPTVAEDADVEEPA